MATLATATNLDVKAGDYVVQVTTTTGSCQLHMAVDGKAAQDISEATWSISTIQMITLPDCVLSATLTGDATLSLSKVKEAREI
jgi:hypothetical protein